MQISGTLNQGAVGFLGIQPIPRKAAGLFIVLLILLNLFVFFPAFFHIARGFDHCVYLLETSNYDNLGDLLANSYSYTRSRVLAPGDKILFRPLFYAYLAFAQRAYGPDFFYWQLTALILHLIVQWQVFRLLNVFRFSAWSLPLVLLSSVMLLPQEMVNRHHLTGYLLFEIFALAAFHRLIRYWKDDSLDEQNFSFMLLWLFLACLSYELGAVMNLLFIGWCYLQWRNRDSARVRRHRKLIWLPVGGYLIMDLLDFFLRVKQFSFGADGLTGLPPWDRFNVFSLAGSLWEVMAMGLSGIFVPAFIRLQFLDVNLFAWGPAGLRNADQVLNTILIPLIAILAAAFAVSLWKKRASLEGYVGHVSFKYGLFMLAAALLYIILFCAVRMQTNPQYIKGSLHHFYTIYVFALAGAGFLFLPVVEDIGRENKRFAFGLGTAILLLILLQASASYQVNRRMMEFEDPERRYIKAIADFVKERQREKDLSFAVDFTSQRHYLVIRPSLNERELLVPLETFIFAKHIAPRPKYYLVYNHGGGLRSFLSREEARAYRRTLKEHDEGHAYWIGGEKFKAQGPGRDLPALEQAGSE